MLQASYPEYANKKQLIGLIANDRKENFHVAFIDSVTEKFLSRIEYQTSEAEKFLKDISGSKNLFKAFIIDLYAVKFSSLTPYETSYKFIVELKKCLQQCQIPYHFISQSNHLFSCSILAANIDVSIGETVMIVLPWESAERAKFELTAAELKFTSNGYQLTSCNEMKAVDAKMDPNILRQQICGSSTPKFIILASFLFKKFPFKKIFNSSNAVFVNGDLQSILRRCTIQTFKWIMDKSNVKYHVLPVSVRDILVCGQYGSKKNLLNVIEIKMNDQLPITKTAICRKSFPELDVLYEDMWYSVGYHTVLPKDCHRYRITLTVDEENAENVAVEKLYFKDFQLIPLKMDCLLETKMPFIGFFDNSSVIGIYKNDKYQFLEEWNGMYGNDCFISFDQKKPQFGNAAMDILKTKNNFVVFDFLKIMSMPSDNIKICKTWGFTFTEDCNNPVLLEFDNFDGTKKAASPAFLMALSLRQHLKAIEAEVGEKPKEIALWFVKEEFNEAEIIRIKEGLSESCKLLKLDYHFVDIDNF